MGLSTDAWISIILLINLLLLALAGYGGWRWFNQQKTGWQRHHDEELQRFLRRLDHELKNPVTSIQFALANLTHTSNNADQQDAILSIKTQVERIRQLITDLRKLAEIDRNAIERIPVDIYEVLKEAVALSTEGTEPRTIQCEIDDLDAEMAVYGDKYLLLLVIYNLLDNALKFTTPTDSISLHVKTSGSAMTITVADTGVGIPEDDIPQVWKELYRSQHTRHIEGSGLGLSMVKAIVDYHDGEVWLESTLDEGTTVTVWLPIYGIETPL